MHALKHADVEVVLVDRHDYHTFQPLLYQLATGLLEQTAVGHSLRDLVHGQANATVHQATVSAVDLGAREVRFEELPPIAYDYLVLALGAEVNFFGTEGAAEHAFPMYTLPDAVRLKDHVLRKWEDADRDPGLVADGALNVVVVGGGPTGVESAGALAELYRRDLAKDFPALPEDQARIILVEAGSQLFSMFKDDIRAYTAKALAERTVRSSRRRGRLRLPDAGHAQVRHRARRAHARVGRRLAGQRARPGARARARARQPHRRRAGTHRSGLPGGVRARRHRSHHRREDGARAPQLGSVALQSGEHAGESIARRVAGKPTKPFRYRDKGTMATIGRGAAVVQMLGGRTMKGKTAQLAWGTVHLALLPTNEDRAKAVVDWAGAALTHQRAGRFVVERRARESERGGMTTGAAAPVVAAALALGGGGGGLRVDQRGRPGPASSRRRSNWCPPCTRPASLRT